MKNPYEYKSGKYLDINLGGEATRLHPKNTHIFTHTQQPEGNHIYIVHRPLSKKNVEATYLWRARFMENENEDKFDRLAHRIGKIGCKVHEAVFMNDNDSKRFYETFGRHALLNAVEHPLTQRHEDIVRHLGETLRAIPADFIMEEMKLPNDFRPYPDTWN